MYLLLTAELEYMICSCFTKSVFVEKRKIAQFNRDKRKQLVCVIYIRHFSTKLKQLPMLGSISWV